MFAAARNAVCLTAILLTLSVSSLSQQAAPVPTAEHVVVNFLLPIDTNSVNMLLAVVNAQVRTGVKKITIVISSPGGDTTAAFAAYNILKNVPVELTTFNAGNIDSAAILIYCAGKHRYSFAAPARFLMHSNALTLGAAVPLDYNFLDAQLQQIKSLNQMIVQVVSASSNKKPSEIEDAIHGQTILTPEDAKRWGIVQEIRTTFMEPGAVLISVNALPVEEKKPALEYSTIKPTVSAGSPTQ
jgi:ATP-dependent Clp protease protease subunit